MNITKAIVICVTLMSGSLLLRRWLTTTTKPIATTITTSSNSTNVRLLITNVNNLNIAEKIASSLVDNRLAACVNILPGVVSVYRWKGKVEKETEVTLLIKTIENNYKKIEDFLINDKNHPYEVPELIEIKIENGFEKYLKWVNEEIN